MKISVVSPVYLGEKLIHELVQRLHNTLKSICDDYEIILVDDGSPDASWEVIAHICQEDAYVKGMKLSRNFGQHYAITAGLQAASGDWVVVMDCDLQDQPEEIVKLLNKTKEGYDIVLGQRVLRQDNWLKVLSSKVFYKVFAYLTDTEQDASIANFGIYHKEVIAAVLAMDDYIRYLPMMVQWVGFRRAKVDVRHSERSVGKSSYSWRRLMKLASMNIIAFSDKPMRLIIQLGLIMLTFSCIAACLYLYEYLTGTIKTMGAMSIIIAMTFLSGLIISMLGVIGIYLGKTFEQVKGRPQFITQKKLNL